MCLTQTKMENIWFDHVLKLKHDLIKKFTE
jgi:hypothetical protein